MCQPSRAASARRSQHGLHPCHGSKGIVEIDPLLLHETSCHQASLVLDDGAGFSSLQLEHPLKGDRTVTAREVGKLPSVVLHNRIHLRLHRGTPCHVSLGLCERPRLTVVAREVQLCLQVVRHQTRRRLIAEKVLHRAVPQRLPVVVRVDALLVVRERSSELHRAVLSMSRSWS